VSIVRLGLPMATRHDDAVDPRFPCGRAEARRQGRSPDDSSVTRKMLIAIGSKGQR
jgi:hypothetical protein